MPSPNLPNVAPTHPIPRVTMASTLVPSSSTASGLVRDPSPVWDIELDLNDDALDWPSGNDAPIPLTRDPLVSREVGPTPTAPRAVVSLVSGTKRPPSPVWDIELDLNVSDEDDMRMETDQPDRKKRRANRDDVD
jgi:hypothetical protein